MVERRRPVSFELELTRRCNNNCRHCYVNVAANDAQAKAEELCFAEIMRLADEAIDLGVLWCLLTGGEPLLRPDFAEIYTALRKKGLLVSVFTNAGLVREEHARLFEKYPPHEIEVTVYGVTGETYERVTRTPGSFTAFRNGLARLQAHHIPINCKTMALRSNVHEFLPIAEFCRSSSKAVFRFDPFLHLRTDGDLARNDEIRAERLSASEIVHLERLDHNRGNAVAELCRKIEVVPDDGTGLIFQCGAGQTGFYIDAAGGFRLCSSLARLECVCNLRETKLADAWNNLVSQVRSLTSTDASFLARCHTCDIVNLCMWCPASADLETGKLDTPVELFCQIAHARADYFGRSA